MFVEYFTEEIKKSSIVIASQKDPTPKKTIQKGIYFSKENNTGSYTSYPKSNQTLF